MSGSEGGDDSQTWQGAVDAAGEKLGEQGHELAAAAEEHLDGLGLPVPDALGEAAGERFHFGQHAEAEAGVEPMAGTVAEEPRRLDFQEADRLPWLESADDDDDDEGGVDTRRVAMFVLAGLALLALIVGGIWWGTHRGSGNERIADGSTIPAPAEPYKQAPENPGGKTYDGTGASSYAVSQGQNPAPHLAGEAADAGKAGTGTGGTGAAVTTAEQAGAVAVAAAKAAGGSATPAPHATATAAPSAAPALAASSGGGLGVQVGAYTSTATAEAGWNKLTKQYAPLAGMHHRIVQGQADIGTVYRLQAVPGSEGEANSLCAGMRGAGLACQVKH